MPSATVDERVVSIRFDNRKFGKNMDDTLDQLDKFDEKLNKHDHTAVLAKIGDGFSAMSIAGITAISRLTNAAINAGEKIVKSLSIDQVTAGWSKYETKAKAVQKLMAALPEAGIDEINEQIEMLNWYADETSYSLTDMISNISTFVSQGVDLDIAKKAIIGVGNAAAMSGANVQDASHAMQGFARALGQGKMNKMVWDTWLQTANLKGTEFSKSMMDAAVAAGTLVKKGDKYYTKAKKTEVTVGNIATTLAEGWLNTDAMMKGLSTYSEGMEDLYNRFQQGEYETTTELLNKEFADADEKWIRAFKFAQEAKSLGEAIDSVKEAVSTAWMGLFETIVGNYVEAKTVWSAIAEDVLTLFYHGFDSWKTALDEWNELGGREHLFSDVEGQLGALQNVLKALNAIVDTIAKAFAEVFPVKTAEQLYEFTERIQEFTKNMVTDENLEVIYNTSRAIFQVLQSGIHILSKTASAIYSIMRSLSPILEPASRIALGVSDLISTITNLIFTEPILNGFAKVVLFVAGIIGGAIVFLIGKIEDLNNYLESIDFYTKLNDFLKKIYGYFQNLWATLKTGADTGSKTWDKIKGLLGTMGGVFLKFAKQIYTAFDAYISKTPYEALIKNLVGLAFAIGSVFFLLKILRGIGAAFDVVIDIRDFFDSLREAIFQIKIGNMIAQISSIMGAITMAAISMAVIGSMDWESWGRGLGGFIAICASLVGMVAVLKLLTKDTRSMVKLIAFAKAITSAIAMLSVALVMTTFAFNMPGGWKSVLAAVVSFVAVMLAMAGAISIMTVTANAMFGDQKGLSKEEIMMRQMALVATIKAFKGVMWAMAAAVTSLGVLAEAGPVRILTAAVVAFVTINEFLIVFFGLMGIAKVFADAASKSSAGHLAAALIGILGVISLMSGTVIGVLGAAAGLVMAVVELVKVSDVNDALDATILIKKVFTSVVEIIGIMYAGMSVLLASASLTKSFSGGVGASITIITTIGAMFGSMAALLFSLKSITDSFMLEKNPEQTIKHFQTVCETIVNVMWGLFVSVSILIGAIGIVMLINRTFKSSVKAAISGKASGTIFGRIGFGDASGEGNAEGSASMTTTVSDIINSTATIVTWAASISTILLSMAGAIWILVQSVNKIERLGRFVGIAVGAVASIMGIIVSLGIMSYQLATVMRSEAMYDGRDSSYLKETSGTIAVAILSMSALVTTLLGGLSGLIASITLLETISKDTGRLATALGITAGMLVTLCTMLILIVKFMPDDMSQVWQWATTIVAISALVLAITGAVLLLVEAGKGLIVFTDVIKKTLKDVKESIDTIAPYIGWAFLGVLALVGLAVGIAFANKKFIQNGGIFIEIAAFFALTATALIPFGAAVVAFGVAIGIVGNAVRDDNIATIKDTIDAIKHFVGKIADMLMVLAVVAAVTSIIMSAKGKSIAELAPVLLSLSVLIGSVAVSMIALAGSIWILSTADDLLQTESTEKVLNVFEEIARILSGMVVSVLLITAFAKGAVKALLGMAVPLLSLSVLIISVSASITALAWSISILATAADVLGGDEMKFDVVFGDFIAILVIMLGAVAGFIGIISHTSLKGSTASAMALPLLALSSIIATIGFTMLSVAASMAILVTAVTNSDGSIDNAKVDFVIKALNVFKWIVVVIFAALLALLTTFTLLTKETTKIVKNNKKVTTNNLDMITKPLLSVAAFIGAIGAVLVAVSASVFLFSAAGADAKTIMAFGGFISLVVVSLVGAAIAAITILSRLPEEKGKQVYKSLGWLSAFIITIGGTISTLGYLITVLSSIPVESQYSILAPIAAIFGGVVSIILAIFTPMMIIIGLLGNQKELISKVGGALLMFAGGIAMIIASIDVMMFALKGMGKNIILLNSAIPVLVVIFGLVASLIQAFMLVAVVSKVLDFTLKDQIMLTLQMAMMSVIIFALADLVRASTGWGMSADKIKDFIATFIVMANALRSIIITIGTVSAIVGVLAKDPMVAAVAITYVVAMATIAVAMYTSMATSIKSIAQAFSDMSATVVEALKITEMTDAEIDAKLKRFKNVVSDIFVSVVTTFAEVATILSGNVSITDAYKAGKISEATVEIATNMSSILDGLVGFTDSMDWYFEKLKDFESADELTEKVKEFGNFIKAVVEQLKFGDDQISSLGDTERIFSGLADAMQTMFDLSYMNYKSEKGNTVLIGDMWNGIMDYFINDLPPLLTEAANKLKPLFAEMADVLGMFFIGSDDDTMQKMMTLEQAIQLVKSKLQEGFDKDPLQLRIVPVVEGSVKFNSIWGALDKVDPESAANMLNAAISDVSIQIGQKLLDPTVYYNDMKARMDSVLTKMDSIIGNTANMGIGSVNYFNGGTPTNVRDLDRQLGVDATLTDRGGSPGLSLRTSSDPVKDWLTGGYRVNRR